MPIVTDEQTEKRPSNFIKLEDKSKFIILSNLYKIKTHFLKAQNTGVLCKGDTCLFCQKGQQARMEYFYYGLVNEEEGVVRVPASVFFALNDQERVLEIKKRDYIWIISKKGTGLDTEYGVARGKEAGAPSISLEEANKKLSALQENYAKGLERKYLEQTGQGAATDLEDAPNIDTDEPKKPANEDVDADDIPF